jgi:20S proteasome subunit alpha 5
MTLLEAHQLALKVLKQVMEEKLDENNVQLAQVSHASFGRTVADARSLRREDSKFWTR